MEISLIRVRTAVSTALTAKNSIVRDIAPCSQVDIHQRCRETHYAASFLLLSCFAYSFTLKMVAVPSTERRNISEFLSRYTALHLRRESCSRFIAVSHEDSDKYSEDKVTEFFYVRVDVAL
jgi:hypothetical protein